MHSTYAGHCWNFIYILTTAIVLYIYDVIFKSHLSRVAMAMQASITAATATIKARMMIQPVKVRKKELKQGLK